MGSQAGLAVLDHAEFTGDGRCQDVVKLAEGAVLVAVAFLTALYQLGAVLADVFSF